MKLLQATPTREEIEQIIKNSVLELIICPGEKFEDLFNDPNEDPKGEKPSKVFLFENIYETTREFKSDMKLIDLIKYMNEENKRLYIFQGERKVINELNSLEKKRNDLLS